MKESYHIKELTLTNFKIYKQAKLSFHQGINILTGMNGVGKTSVLDAIRLLVFGKSYFGSQDKSNIAHSEQFLRAAVNVLENQEPHTIVAKIQQTSPKVLELDGKKIGRLSTYLGRYLSVCISPDDISLVNGQSSDRRNFMDQSIIQFDKTFTQQLTRYNKALKQRNSALKSFLKHGNYDENLLKAFENIMIETAPYIHETRTKFIDKFKSYFESAYVDIAPDREIVSIDYESKLHESEMSDLVAQYRDKDKYSGRTNAGIHKDDLSFTLNDAELKVFGSQGQIKSFVFALKIAQFEYFVEQTNKVPILLLDDMFDKLDSNRVENILTHLNEKWGAQVFITDTDKNRISSFLKDRDKNFRHIHILPDQTIELLDV